MSVQRVALTADDSAGTVANNLVLTGTTLTGWTLRSGPHATCPDDIVAGESVADARGQCVGSLRRRDHAHHGWTHDDPQSGQQWPARSGVRDGQEPRIRR